MSKALPPRQAFASKDTRRVAMYYPLGDFAGETPEKVKAHTGPVYVLDRTVRTRRGFGTILHSLVTFTTRKSVAHTMASNWVKVQTKDRR